MNCHESDFLELSYEILSRGDCLRFRARGGSMSPFIRDGEIIEVKPVEIRHIREGDIVLYRTRLGSIRAHRVIEKRRMKEGTVLVPKGDALPNLDVPIHSDQVLGRVVVVERSGRNIRFDNGLHRLVGILYAKVSPFSPWVYPILRRVKRAVSIVFGDSISFPGGERSWRNEQDY